MNRDMMQQEDFEGFLSIAELRGGGISRIPQELGVYAVIREEMTEPQFLRKNPGGHFKGRDPSVDLSKLREKWVHGAAVLYFGRAGGKSFGKQRTLRKRIEEFLEFGASRPVPHWGGRLVWQISGSDQFLICWRATDDPIALERRMIERFKALHGKLPFANCRR